MKLSIVDRDLQSRHSLVCLKVVKRDVPGSFYVRTLKKVKTNFVSTSKKSIVIDGRMSLLDWKDLHVDSCTMISSCPLHQIENFRIWLKEGEYR